MSTSARPVVRMTATARPTFAVEAATERWRAARTLVEDLGAEVTGPEGLLLTPDDVGDTLTGLDADLFVHVCATFADASTAIRLYRIVDRPIVLWAFREPGRDGDRLWLNSLCGANLVGHALIRAGHDVRFVYGDPDEAPVRNVIAEMLAGRLPERPVLPPDTGIRGDPERARVAVEHLHGRRIGALGAAPTGFTPSAYDETDLEARFGVTVAPRPLGPFLAEAAAVPVAVRRRELTDARSWQPSLSALDPEHLDRFAATTVTLRDWVTADGLDAVAVRCWPEFPTELGVCPCSSLSRLADEGVPTQCERDVLGAVTMLMLQALDTGPTFLVDTVDVVPERNVVRFWHCGAAPTALAADPSDATQSVHANRKIGVAGDFALKPGRVTIARADPDPAGGFRLLLAGGSAVDAPNRFQGNTAEVMLDSPADEFVSGLVTGGFPHHTVLAWADARPAMRSIADLLGLTVVEFG